MTSVKDEAEEAPEVSLDRTRETERDENNASTENKDGCGRGRRARVVVGDTNSRGGRIIYF